MLIFCLILTGSTLGMQISMGHWGWAAFGGVQLILIGFRLWRRSIP
jgi:hypothetical protein